MVNATAEAENKMQTEAYWDRGRLVAHVAGEEAGQMRLDIDLPGFDSVEDVRESVKLVIPGERTALKAVDAVGENGRFVVSFFSSDIANAGHVPAEAVVCWDTDGRDNRTKPVDVVSATEVRQEESEEAANVPGSGSAVNYPKTVALMAIGALALAVGVVFAILLQN